MPDVLIIGGGPAGMMAAIAAAENGKSVLLLERNEKLGKKLYITGKGRCNLTNNCSREDFFASVPRNPKFLFSAYSHLNPQQLMQLMEQWGLPLVTERGQRVFPSSQKASDVTKTLVRRMNELGVKVQLNTRISRIITEDGTATGAEDENGRQYKAGAVIVATGGVSYPTTGSTGDGYGFAEDSHIEVKQAIPSLVSLETEERWIPELQGLSLKNVTLTASRGKKVLYSELGEMMFTHYGITGPLVLTLSALLPEEASEVKVNVDLKPGLSREQLDNRIQRDFEKYSSRTLSGALTDLFPNRLIGSVLTVAGLRPEQSIHHLTKAEYTRLVDSIKALPITIKKRRGFDEAVVTRGGISVKEIDPRTMESKKIKNLYFAGEVLDVDGFTGGFNLQIAFSTGYTAGLASRTGDE